MTDSPDDGRGFAVGPDGGFRETYDFSIPISGETEADTLLRLWLLTYLRLTRSGEHPGLGKDALAGELYGLTFLRLRTLRDTAPSQEL